MIFVEDTNQRRRWLSRDVRPSMRVRICSGLFNLIMIFVENDEFLNEFDGPM